MLDIKEHSDEMALLGERIGLMNTIIHINKNIAKIDKKLKDIEHRKTVRILEDSGNETST
jgi:hypothetical protein